MKERVSAVIIQDGKLVLIRRVKPGEEYYMLSLPEGHVSVHSESLLLRFAYVSIMLCSPNLL